MQGERRNVGLLVASPTTRTAWLRRASLKQRVHLVANEADFVKRLLDLLFEEARQVVRAGDAAVMHAWMKSMALPTDDALSLSSPAIGIAADLDAEVRRLRTLVLGRGPGGGTNTAERLRTRVLRNLGITDAFRPREFPSGPATWRFGAVADLPTGPLLFNALRFGHKTPENVLDAGFKNAGRVADLRHYHPKSAASPSPPVRRRAPRLEPSTGQWDT